VNKVVELNPILTGKLVAYDRVLLYQHEKFLDFISLNNEIDIRSLNPSEKLDFLKNVIEPNVVNLKDGFSQYSNGTQLFKVTVFDLGNECVCVSTSVSHSIADGYTYYNIIKQIDDIMNDRKITEFEWESLLRFNFNIKPYATGLIESIIGEICRFICFAFKWLFFTTKPNYSLILSQKELDYQKKILKSKDVEFLSSNDVITSALCESNHDMDVAVFVVNARGRMPEYAKNLGGNFEKTVPFDTKICSDPNYIRRAVSKLRFFNDWELPYFSYLIGRFGIITNWSTLAQFFTFGGLKVECHAPFHDFVSNTPCDLGVIYRFDENTLAISHNYKNMDMTGIIGDIIQ
jgi:hypothetical protein